MDFDARKATTGYDHPYEAKVIEQHRLNTGGVKPYTHLTLGIEGIENIALPGDAIGIWVENPPAMVEAVLASTGWDGDTPVTLTETHGGWQDENITHHRLPLRQMLTHHVELITPRREWLEALAVAPLKPEATPLHRQRLKALQTMLRDEEACKALQANYTVLELLRLLPTTLSPQALCDHGWQVDQRRFTISEISKDSIGLVSSPIAYERVHLPLLPGDVSESHWQEGIWTQQLKRLQAGQSLRCYIDPKNFGLPSKPMEGRPPTSDHVPMIFIGPGTGIAPYLPMMEALADGHPGCWLITGNKSASTDLLYAERLMALQRKKILKRLLFAESGDKNNTHVQDSIYEQAQILRGWVARGAHVYLCGDRAMAEEVRAVLADMGVLEELQKNGRFFEDSYRQSQEFERAQTKPAIKADIVVLGSGPAGCSAAMTAARQGFSTLMVAGNQPGGQVSLTGWIENYPGFDQPIAASVLTENMQQQALQAGASRLHGAVVAIEGTRPPFRLRLDTGQTIEAQSVILATGAAPRFLGVLGEKEYLGRGVSTCALCDGVFFADKPVVVVGGGDSAVEEALQLQRMGAQVTLIHRGEKLRASHAMQEKLFAVTPPITVHFNGEVSAIEGAQTVEKVRLRDGRVLPCKGVFIAIGHTPNSTLVEGLVARDAQGYVLSTRQQTSVPGIFAAGEITDPRYRQIATAVGDGVKAALEACMFMRDRLLPKSADVPIVPLQKAA
jgi:thioredoxin reductase (NADPH)